MKTLNAKIPFTIAQAMDDQAQLNPNYVVYFVNRYMGQEIDDKPLEGMCYNYTFKVDENFHQEVKLQALIQRLPMNEMIGRLFRQYY